MSFDNDTDQLNFMMKPVEYEPVPIPVEQGMTNLSLFIETQTEPFLNVKSRKLEYEKYKLFDNKRTLYPYTPKRIVRNGQIIDQTFNDFDSQDEQGDNPRDNL